MLAHVFEYLRVAHLNVQETENIIFDGAHAAVARINLDGAPSARALDAMQSGNADILDLQLVKLAWATISATSTAFLNPIKPSSSFVVR